MKWRLREGHGEAIYEIGVEDTGMLTGLSVDDMKSSLYTLDQMADKLGATTSVLRERSVRKDKMVAEVLVRKVYISIIYIIVCNTKVYIVSCVFIMNITCK